MRFTHQVFRKNIFSHYLQVIVASFAFILVGCGGTNSTPVVTEDIITLPSIAAKATFSDERYNLVKVEGYETSGLQAYWSSQNELPVTFQTLLQASLPKINNIFKQQHFAFNQVLTGSNSPVYKKIFFSPRSSLSDTDTTEHNDLTATFTDDGTLKVEFDAKSLLTTTEFSTQLIQLIYQSERFKHQPSNNLLSRLVTRGLALHFVEENVSDNDFTTSVVIDIAELRFALSQVDAELNEDALIENWFMNKPLREQYKANALGYYLVSQHFSQYSGSNASNTFSVSSDLFSPWLSGASNSVKKERQYVRTQDIPDQIEVSELERQANLYVGKFFLEGLHHEKLIALSFDDGPSEYTAQILDVLNTADVPASFFWQGQLLSDYEDVVKRSIEEGHTVANHSWNHANGMNYSEENLWLEQVVKTNDEFQRLFNITPRFYRPPYGEITDAQIEHLASKGMKVLLWSVDSRDWNPELNSVKQIESEVINNQHEEVISLMHDAGGDRKNTVDSLPAIIKHYKEQGYRFVTIETLLGISDKH